jgi:hypothetical protein
MRKALTLCFIVCASLLVVGCTNTAPGADSGSSSNASGNSSLQSASECLPNCEIMGELKDTCIEGCWLQEAERTLNPDVCIAHVTDSLLQVGCIMNVSVKAQDPDMCERLGDSADLCYSSYADETNDESICDKIGDEFIKAVCTGNFE